MMIKLMGGNSLEMIRPGWCVYLSVYSEQIKMFKQFLFRNS